MGGGACLDDFVSTLLQDAQVLHEVLVGHPPCPQQTLQRWSTPCRIAQLPSPAQGPSQPLGFVHLLDTRVMSMSHQRAQTQTYSPVARQALPHWSLHRASQHHPSTGSCACNCLARMQAIVKALMSARLAVWAHLCLTVASASDAACALVSAR